MSRPLEGNVNVYRDPVTGNWHGDYTTPVRQLDGSIKHKRYRPSLAKIAKGCGLDPAKMTKARALQFAREKHAEDIAEAHAEIAKVEAVAGTPDGVAPTFSSWCTRYFATYGLEQLGPLTTDAYKRLIERVFSPVFGAKRLDEIKQADIELWRANALATRKRSDGEPVSALTINKEITILRGIFERAVERDDLPMITVNPCARVRKIRVDRDMDDYAWHNAEEMAAVLGVVRKRNPHYYVVLLLLYRTGIRMGEMRGIKPEDVSLSDLSRASVQIKRSWPEKLTKPQEMTKGGNMRTLPIPHDAALALAAYMKTRPASEWLFGGPDGETPPDSTRLGPAFKRAAKLAGVRQIKLHGTRHSLASQLVLANVPLPVIQKFLGHADIETTARYMHVRPGALDTVRDVIGADGALGSDGLPDAPLSTIARRATKPAQDSGVFAPFLPLLGTMPDRLLAEKAGVSFQYVGRIRAQRGIPVFTQTARNAEPPIAAK